MIEVSTSELHRAVEALHGCTATPAGTEVVASHRGPTTALLSEQTASGDFRPSLSGFSSAGAAQSALRLEVSHPRSPRWGATPGDCRKP